MQAVETDLEALRVAFVEHAKPRIERAARIFFRKTYDPDRKEDQIAETVGIAWKCFVQVTENDKDPMQFVSRIADFSCKQVAEGRRVAGAEKATSVSNPNTQKRLGFRMLGITDSEGREFVQSMCDNRAITPSDQAAFRIDTTSWLNRLGLKKREIAEELIGGESTTDVAHNHHVTPARVSQIRGELRNDYLDFQSDCER